MAKRLGRVLLLAALALFGAALGLFFVYASYFSEGANTSWDGTVLAGAWSALFASGAVGIVGLVTVLWPRKGL